MAYSDFGGMVWKNGERFTSRCDCNLWGINNSLVYDKFPGFKDAVRGVDREKVVNAYGSAPNGHAVLGDYPVYLALNKAQMSILWFGGHVVPFMKDGLFPQTHFDNNLDICENPCKESTEFHHFLMLADGEDPYWVHFDLPDNVDLWIRWHSTNGAYYTMAKLTMPNGDKWHGWSTYWAGHGFWDTDRKQLVETLKYSQVQEAKESIARERALDDILYESWKEDFPNGIPRRELLKGLTV